MDPYYPHGAPTAPQPYVQASDETINNPAGSRKQAAQHFPDARVTVPGNETSNDLPVSLSFPGPEYHGEVVESNTTAQWPLHPSTPEFVNQTISQQPTPPVQPEDKLAHVRAWLAQDDESQPANNAPQGFRPFPPRPARTYPMPLQPQQTVHPPWAAPSRFEPARQASYSQYGFGGIQGSPHQFSFVDASRQVNPFAFTAQQQGPQPAIQQWPTSNLTQPRDPSVHPFGGPLPGRSSPGEARVDKKTLKWQPQYAGKEEAVRVKQTGQARRKQVEVAREVEQAAQTNFEQSPQSQDDYHLIQQSQQEPRKKRKSSPTVDSLLAPQAPALRHTPLNGSIQYRQLLQHQQYLQRLQHRQRLQYAQQSQYGYHNVAAIGLGQQPRQGSISSEYPGQYSFHSANSVPQYFQPMNITSQYIPPTSPQFLFPEFTKTPPQYQRAKAPPREDTPPEPVITDPDDLPQSITDIYEDYKWSVKLYEVTASAFYDFAQSFLEDVFEKHNLYNLDSSYKWHAHTTKGFIKDGSRLTFVVLHNAANPFEWGLPPESTTSIGVYGRYANNADKEMHWKTFTPDIRTVLQEYMDEGYFCLKMTWKFDMVKATERRFHRAYWHAARMLPLGGLLNHACEGEAAHDAVETDEDIEFTEEDLQTGWEDGDGDEEKAAVAWQNILSQNEENEWFDGEAVHVVTGCSEWDQFGD